MDKIEQILTKKEYNGLLNIMNYSIINTDDVDKLAEEIDKSIEFHTKIYRGRMEYLLKLQKKLLKKGSNNGKF